MPKIEVNERLFFQLCGKRWGRDELEARLSTAKAELDDWAEGQGDGADRAIKIELNDTNRPDLWSTAGVARALRVYSGKAQSPYPFFSRPGDARDSGGREIRVDPSAQAVRPFIGGFVISGKPIDEPMLKDIIQTQEKLCWNYGRKRKSIAMGVYRSALIKYPVRYRAADPDKTRFMPLGLDRDLCLRDILKEHPKGQEFGSILAGLSSYPFLEDDSGEVLSFPPIINSAKIGAVESGDGELFVEMTGTDLPSLCIALNIVACDFHDSGYQIKSVKAVYPYDTPFGRELTFPYYFQAPVSCDTALVKRILGEDLSAEDCVKALARQDIRARAKGKDAFEFEPPEYRNDFLHPADAVEDVMIGRGLGSFKPERPRDFTIGRLHKNELLSRKAKGIMVGLGYQEMIYNYLGSGKDFVEKMRIKADEVIRISNPMSENYEYLRNSTLPCLLESEALSQNAAYPHRTFETGKVARVAPEANYGTVTKHVLGFLSSHAEANFNQIASDASALLYYLGFEYAVEESEDPRFIPGRQAYLLKGKERVGVFGEVHPEVLERWGLSMPCVAGEIDLEAFPEAAR
jgi:phenylalanyl-tRNA synthetase beta chain